VLLQVFVRGWAAGGAAGGPALDVREDASKLHTNQNMFSHPGTRGPHAKDEILSPFLENFLAASDHRCRHGANGF